MNIYLAARYSRHPEMREIRDRIEAAGPFKITSRWIDLHPTVTGVGELGPHEDSATVERLNTDPDSCSVFALHDLADIAAADVVISFTNNGGGGKGGRHIEFGYGYATDKIMVVVGPRENVFHCLPGVIVLEDDRALGRWLDTIRQALDGTRNAALQAAEDETMVKARLLHEHPMRVLNGTHGGFVVGGSDA